VLLGLHVSWVSFIDNASCKDYCIRQFCGRSVDCRGPSSEGLCGDGSAGGGGDEMWRVVYAGVCESDVSLGRRVKIEMYVFRRF
jgi:hypothetical protein